ncbi:hypothetical protein K1X76_00820 [bacterium]|nr:hypothetical protein [bacterium]
MKKIQLFTALMGLFVSFSVFAKEEYLYRRNVNWVKINDASSKDIPLGTLKHPNNSISVEQMEGMLLSIKINKQAMFKKEVNSVDVFDAWEARQYAPLLAEGLSKAGPDQVVNFSMVHKRPIFILQKDYISIANVFVATDGVHFQFTKLYAKIEGDYQAAHDMDKALRKAHTMRLALDAGAGQMLSYNGTSEIVLDPAYDFVSQAYNRLAKAREDEEQSLRGKKAAKKEVSEEQKLKPGVSSTPSYSNSGDPAARLKKLDTLKAQKLITDKEYQDLRKKILSEL